MVPVLRVTFAVVILTLLLVGPATVRWRWLAELGLDLGSLEEALQLRDAERRHEEQLADASRQVLHRMQVKTRIAQAVVARKTTLREATAHMRALLDAAPAESWEHLRRLERGATDTERLGRHVIGWVRATLLLEEARIDAECDRLEQELRQMLK